MWATPDVAIGWLEAKLVSRLEKAWLGFAQGWAATLAVAFASGLGALFAAVGPAGQASGNRAFAITGQVFRVAITLFPLHSSSNEKMLGEF
jgi:hypothetical protein